MESIPDYGLNINETAGDSGKLLFKEK